MKPSKYQYSHSSLRHKMPQLNRKVTNELQRRKEENLQTCRASFLFIVSLIKLSSIKTNYHHHKF